MEQSSIIILYLNFFKTFRQKIMLRIMSKFYIILEILRNRRNFDIYCITGYCVFSGTILMTIKGLKIG